ncbi:MAG: hypothetical protein KGR98_01320 [Verrucomicrobia bacterium]|nr:hypothetical protein [Verrucomicrobiota bacterium]MDE3098671.1 hypothetical protein [Verrucomicrobiota bacterium]
MNPPHIRAGEICLIMATRGRPQMLAEVFAALRATTARPDGVSLWLYVDEDDTATRRAMDGGALAQAGARIHWHIGPQTGGLCETQHALWRESGRTAEIYMVLADDICFLTKGWDDILRDTARKFPDGVFLACPYDPTTADTCTYPIFGWRWLETLGRMFPGYFPYWFDDRWVHQIGEMAGCYARLPIDLRPIGGKGRTRRMRDLPFWTRFFQLTLDERKADAKKLIDALAQDPEKKAAAERNLQQRAAAFARQQNAFSDLYNVFQEERFSMHDPAERRAFNRRYFEREAAAVAELAEYAQDRMSREKFSEAIDFLDATFLSNLRVRQIHDMKAACLRALGRDAEAGKLARETLAPWPEMNLARRLFRFFGMVASDTKTMIIGFLQKGGKKK